VAKLVLWNKAGEDLWGTVARMPRIVDSMQELLGDEVYHYHSKMEHQEPFNRRRVGVASGLRLLVSERMPVS